MYRKQMKGLILFLFFSCILFVSDNVNALSKETQTMENIEKYTDPIPKTIPVKNMSIAITKKDKRIFSKQYGENITENSNFILGSTSKSFTVSAVMELVSKNRIHLEDVAKSYLPNRKLSNRVTILDLLNHTSGISVGDKPDNDNFSGIYGEFEYSNTNYNFLGEIVGAVSGKDFSRYMEETAFPALSMSNSFPLTRQTSGDIVQGYNSIFGFPTAIDPRLPTKNSLIQPASGYLCSNTADMTTYMRHCLADDELLPRVKKQGVEVSDDPAIEGMFSNKGTYGFGWICKVVDGKEILYHTGKTATFNSLVVLIPEEKIGVTMLYSYGDFLVGTPMIEQANEAVVSLLLGKKLTKEPGSYLLKHVLIDFVLLILVIISTLFALKQGKRGHKIKRILKIVCGFIVPILFFLAIELLGTPIEDLFEFIPSTMVTLAYCSIMFLVSSGLGIYTLLWKR
ncbi:serine hydrolase [Enterococcus sp. DIV0187]|uniref:serine hydrolase n=1 Tax=Enterococcus sp. DIV0187 TaxID=2774644 RepID=UPI003F682577